MGNKIGINDYGIATRCCKGVTVKIILKQKVRSIITLQSNS